MLIINEVIVDVILFGDQEVVMANFEDSLNVIDNHCSLEISQRKQKHIDSTLIRTKKIEDKIA